MTSGSFYFYAGKCFAGKTLSREGEIQPKSQLYLGTCKCSISNPQYSMFNVEIIMRS